MENDKSAIEFLSALLSETKEQFKKSPVYEKQYKQKKEANYSVCATPILKHAPVLFGINWGGSDIFESQEVTTQFDDITKYPFIKRSQKYLEQLGLSFSEINFNYTNLCFFRSRKAIELEEGDYRLSIPLFEKYVNYINPKWILSIGYKNYEILNKLGFLKSVNIHTDKVSKAQAYSAKLWDRDIYFAPHPNAHFSNEKRNAIWAIITTELNRETKG